MLRRIVDVSARKVRHANRQGGVNTKRIVIHAARTATDEQIVAQAIAESGFPRAEVVDAVIANKAAQS